MGCASSLRHQSAIKNRQSKISSLVSQRFHRLDSAGAPCREKASEQSSDEQYQGDNSERAQIERHHAVQSRLHGAAYQISSAKADDRSDGCQNRSLLQDKIQYSRALRTEGHAQTKLLCPLRYAKSHHAIDSDRCEQQRHHCKASEQHHRKAIDSKLFCDDLVHCLDAG